MGIPAHIVIALARTVLPEIKAFYESKEGQEYFERWKAEQTQKNNAEK